MKNQQLYEYSISKGYNFEIVIPSNHNLLKNEIINNVEVTRLNLRSQKSFYLVVKDMMQGDVALMKKDVDLLKAGHEILKQAE